VTDRLEYVIRDGQVLNKEAADAAAHLSPEQMDRHNLVMAVVEGGAVTLRWFASGRNWASLFVASEWIESFPGPYSLNYYVSGWFRETFVNCIDARERLFDLIAKSDVHLSSSIYVSEPKEDRDGVPELLRSALQENRTDEEHSIDCFVDPHSGRFKVQRVGAQSSIAKFYGLMTPISYPCLTGHSYDQVVSRIYPEVARSGHPHYDHVYAAMAAPDGDVMWIPYQRVVLPLHEQKGRQGVRIITELTKVDVRPL
jgi:hypothetical protein